MTSTGLLLLGLIAMLRTKSKEPPHSVPDAIAPYGLTRAAPPPVEEPAKPKRRRGSRLGKILIALGVLLIAYSGAVIFWGDPATDLYARWKQHQLAGQFADGSAGSRQQDGVHPGDSRRPGLAGPAC